MTCTDEQQKILVKEDSRRAPMKEDLIRSFQINLHDYLRTVI